MSLIILSALGTGQYREAKYQSEHHSEPIVTGLFAVALHQWYPEAQVKLLTTEVARQGSNGEYVHAHYPNFELIDIPDSRTEEEAWELFQSIADHIPQGSRVIFDITHGLRSLPMLGFLALSYLRVVKQITIERVFYGALELTPRVEDALTPVIDLTPFVSLLDWAQAAQRFQDTGDATLFKPLIRKDGRSSLVSVANKLDILSMALASNRTIEVGQLATELTRQIADSSKQEMLSQHKPFLVIMDEISNTIEPLKSNDDIILNLISQYNQVLWYYNRGLHVQSIGLMREWIISIITWKTSGELQLGISERGEAEQFIGQYARSPKEAPEEYQEICALWDKITKLRNDLLHFGMRPIVNRSKSGGIKSSVGNLLLALPKAVYPLGLKLDLELKASGTAVGQP